MKMLCNLKRKDVAHQFDATLESLRENAAEPGYLCRDCLRFSCEKKRLCQPVSLKKLKGEHEPPSTAMESR
ncbi:MAG: hypothetical protein Q8M16_04625 [Pirellulaceae bacterium]|nr:hypothetical protein [Pirellulaceae bacterium]